MDKDDKSVANNEIVSLYLYTKERTTFISKDPLRSFRGKEDRVYVINPMFRPIPPGANLFSALYTKEGTTSLLQTYDPFDIPKNSVQFIAWVEPVPHTTPLYVFQNNEYIYCTFDQQSVIDTEMKQIPFSPIYVFTMEAPAVNSIDKTFNGNEYKFSPYKGRCIPDPSGTSMAQCIEQHIKGKGRYTLLSYLESKYNTKTANVLFYISLAMLLGFVIVFTVKHVL